MGAVILAGGVADQLLGQRRRQAKA